MAVACEVVVEEVVEEVSAVAEEVLAVVIAVAEVVLVVRFVYVERQSSGR